MRAPTALTAIALLSFVPACGSPDNGQPASKKPSSAPSEKPSGDSVSQAGAFNPAPVAEGYQRFESQTIHGVVPGSDVTFCQYVMGPLDHDVDILDVTGEQSAFGHHAVAFSYTDDGTQELGTSVPCMGTEFSSGTGDMGGGAAMSVAAGLNIGGFLGGTAGPKGGRSAPLPDGVSFRLKKGDGIMLNVHYLNTGDKPVDGDAVIDVKFGDADPNRLIAAMFLNLNLGFKLPPNAPTASTVECVAQSDVKILMMSNHMHEFGTSATSEVVRAGSSTSEMLHEDPSWSYEMQFNPVYSKWTAEAPFMLKAGDTVRTTCRWENSKAEELAFPREMCVGVGFALTTGDNPHAPACAGGVWLDHLL